MTGKATEFDQFYWHEAMDRTSMCCDILDTVLENHPIISSDERYQTKLYEAQKALCDLYQMIGSDIETREEKR